MKDDCQDTTGTEGEVIEQSIMTVTINGEKWFQIDERFVPVLFRFKYSALLQMRMSTHPKVPPYANWLFQQLIKKILTTRYSTNKSRKSLAVNTRMKSQQKVKFLVRAFELKYTKQFEVERYVRMRRFDSKSQQQFFRKEEVQKHFLPFLPAIIRDKQAFNQNRIKEVEKDLMENLKLGQKCPQKGKEHFRRVIDKLQLPWTDNMFTDIETFGRKLFESYVHGVCGDVM